MLISVNINIGLVVMECARGTRMSILKISPFTLKKPVPATQARLQQEFYTYQAAKKCL